MPPYFLVPKTASLPVIAILVRGFSFEVRGHLPNKVSRHHIGGKEFFIKRDDALQLDINPEITGNKGRKMLALSRHQPFPSLVVSYGGHQSNSMLAVARLVALYRESSNFVYFSKKLPTFLKEKQVGNLQIASALGMKLVELPSDVYNQIPLLPKRNNEFPEEILGSYLRSVYDGDTGRGPSVRPPVYWIPQGVAMPEAELGISGLVDELLESIKSMKRNVPYRRWKVLIASGTGTMALFAARHFHQRKLASASLSSSREERQNNVDIEVVAVACAGTDNDLMQQMEALDAVSGNIGVFPSLLPSDVAPKRHFGEVCSEHLDIWRQLQQDTGIDFDLIYAPRAFEQILASFRNDPQYWKDCGVIYYHCGGVEGNESQLGRYRHMKLL